MSYLAYPDYTNFSTDTECVYTGTWTLNIQDNSGTNVSIKAAKTSTTGDQVVISPSVPFTDAVLFCYASGDGGIMDVYVDNVKVASFDCYLFNTNPSVNPCYNCPIVRLSGLSNTTHIIKLVCTGTKGVNSTGFTIGFNYGVYLDPNTPVGVQIPNRFLFTGDSITDMSPSFSQSIIPPLANNLRSGSKLIFKYLTRAGVGSDLARFVENAIIAWRPAFVSFMFGTNDIGFPAQLNNTFTNYKLILDACKKWKVDCQICTIPPKNGVTAFYYQDLNDKIRQLAWQYNIPLIDWDKAVFNDTPGTTTPFRTDGVHPDAVGFSLMGNYMFEIMTSQGHPFRKLLLS